MKTPMIIDGNDKFELLFKDPSFPMDRANEYFGSRKPRYLCAVKMERNGVEYIYEVWITYDGADSYHHFNLFPVHSSGESTSYTSDGGWPRRSTDTNTRMYAACGFVLDKLIEGLWWGFLTNK